jgi:hypothetical protein
MGVTKKPDLNPVLRAKLAKGMGHNYYGEPAWPNDLLYIFPCSTQTESERSNAVLSTSLMVHLLGRFLVGYRSPSRRSLRLLRLDCLLPLCFSSRHSSTGFKNLLH